MEQNRIHPVVLGVLTLAVVCLAPARASQGAEKAKRSIPVRKHGKQTHTIVPNEQGGMVVEGNGGKGPKGYDGSFKTPKK